MASFRELLAQAKQQIREIEPAEAEEQLGTATFLDVRELDEHEQGTIPGSVFVPRGHLESQAEQKLPNRDTPIVVYCAGGARSAFAAKTLIPIDLELGLKAVEVRIWGLGQPYDNEEKQWSETSQTEPLFPFPFLAYADAMYENALKDTKTAHRLLMPDYLTALQLTLYRLPWLQAGYTDFKAGIDQFAKRKDEQLTKEKDYRAYWLESDESRDQQAIKFVLQVAQDISRGIFPPRPSYMCLFDHGMPGLVRAER